MTAMKLVKMKALAVGTVVGDVLNPLTGETNTNSIVHVDPDNNNEDGRYNEPVVTEMVAKKLEDAKFAERTGTVEFKNGFMRELTADEEAERNAEFSDADSQFQQPSALDTRNTVNFTDGDRVRGGEAGTAQASDDDAPPAPKAAAKPAAKPAT